MKKSALWVVCGFLGMSAAFSSTLLASASIEDVIQAEEVRLLQEQKADFVLLDARGQSAYKTEHIDAAVLALVPEYYQKQDLFHAGVVSVPPDVDQYLKQSTDQYPKSAKIVTYCNRGCQASEVLMSKLKTLGFSDVKFMKDGIDAWKEKGFPVVSAT